MSQTTVGVQQREWSPAVGGGLLPILAPLEAIFPLDAVLAGMVGAGQGIQAICLYLGLSHAGLDEHLVRLGLTRPHGRPPRGGGRNPWRLNEISSLIAWRVAGIHPETIGVRLGRTPGAVRSKARRLGIPRPARKALRRVDPLGLQLILPGLGLAPLPARKDAPLCGHSPGAVASAGLQHFQAGREQGKGAADRRETSKAEAFRPATAVMSPAPAIPGTKAEVDLSGDLTWIGALRRPQSNRLAVWAIGMLFLGGLYYKEIATRIGKTPAAVRTLRTRCGVPIDETRKNITRRMYDEEVAYATCALSGYAVKQCLETGVWFWEHKRNHGCKVAPMVRRKRGIRDTQIEGRSPTFIALTREDLKSIPPPAFLPFAHRSPTLRAR